MKNIIVIIGMTILGVIIFNMMVGSGEDSLKNITKEIMLETIEFYNEAGEI